MTNDKLTTFTHYWDMLGDNTPYVTDYQALKPRRFKFDVAFISERVAVEIDGGVYTQGRHVRPTGYVNDCVKNNLAIERDWVMFRFTPQMIEDDPTSVIKQVQSVIRARRGKGG